MVKKKACKLACLQAFFGGELGFFFGILPYAFASLRSLTTSAKTVRRTVFFRRQVCSLLVRIPFLFCQSKKQALRPAFHFGGELGIFRHTAVCLRVALLLDHVGENSPPDCFLPQTSLLPPCSNPKQKREAMPKHHFSFWRRVRDSNPRYITYTAFRVLHLRPLGQLSIYCF